MAIIAKTTYAKRAINETIHLTGACVPAITYANVIVGQYNESSPNRPTRRPKPEFLLFNPTAYGPFYKRSYKAREETFRRDITSCSGKPGSAIQYIRTIETCASLFPNYGIGVKVPSWEIPMRLKIKNERVNMAETIGEWKETAKTVSGAATALRNAMRFVNKLRRLPKSRWPLELKELWSRRETLTIRDIPGAYLCTIFGVAPWVELANSASEALALAATQGIYKRFSVTRRGTKVETIRGVRGGELKIVTTVTRRAVMLVKYKPLSGSFTSGNLLEALYAGAPMSFVVDWFIGLGSWLSAIDALDGVESMTGTLTTRTRKVATDTRLNTTSNTLYTPAGCIAGTALELGYRRQVITDVGLPWTLEWGNSASWGKLITSLAILHELRR